MQKTRAKAVLTLTEALIPRSMFDALPDYSCSLPTGRPIGKCWKRNTSAYTTGEDGPWLLGCFERLLPPEEPGAPGRRGRSSILIRWRAITVVDL